MTHMLLVVSLLLAAQHAGHHAPLNPAHEVDARGESAMGFAQDQTRHRFLLHADGGTIDVAVLDPADGANLAAIRAHLPHVADAFSAGNFALPHFIHAQDVPGSADMARLRDRITYRYEPTPHGGRVRMVTHDEPALAAIHAFMRFQIADHRTGDPLHVTPVP